MTPISGCKIGLTALALACLATGARAQSLFAPPETAPSYYQCMIRANGSRAEPSFKDAYGHLGLFQFSVQTAQQAGLCSHAVPVSGQQQIWDLCDFKGQVAIDYKIANEHDLLYGDNAVKAQFAMLDNLTKAYDDYIYKQKYDLLFDKMISGIVISREALHAILIAYGKVATDEFLKGHHIDKFDGSTPYTISTCVQLCVETKAKYWNCPLQ